METLLQQLHRLEQFSIPCRFEYDELFRLKDILESTSRLKQLQRARSAVEAMADETILSNRSFFASICKEWIKSNELDKSNWEQCVQLLRLCIPFETLGWDSRRKLARFLTSAREYDDARISIAEAIDLALKDALIPLSTLSSMFEELAHIEMYMDHHHEAEIAVNNAIAFSSEFGSQLRVSKAVIIWESLSRRHEALELVRHAGPQHWPLQASLSLHLWELEETLKTVRHIIAKCAEHHENTAAPFLFEGDVTNVLANAFSCAGSAYLVLHRHDQACECFKSALEYQKTVETCILLADALFQRGNFDEATEFYDVARSLTPLDVNAWHGIALIEERKQGVEAAEKLFRDFMSQLFQTEASVAERAQAYSALGHILSLNKREDSLPKALDLFNKALTLDPAAHTALYWKSVALQQAKRFEEAILTAETAIASAPDLHQPYQVKIECLRRLNRLEEALECANKFLKIIPLVHFIWYQKAITLKALGRTDKAMKLLERVVKRCSISEAHVALAEIYMSNGQENIAQEHLKKAEENKLTIQNF